jgi:hypothetical protein
MVAMVGMISLIGISGFVWGLMKKTVGDIGWRSLYVCNKALRSLIGHITSFHGDDTKASKPQLVIRPKWTPIGQPNQEKVIFFD